MANTPGALSGLSSLKLALMAKQARLQGIIVGSRTHQREMIAALDASAMRPVIDRSFALGDIADAFRHEASGQHFGKIVLEF